MTTGLSLYQSPVCFPAREFGWHNSPLCLPIVSPPAPRCPSVPRLDRTPPPMHRPGRPHRGWGARPRNHAGSSRGLSAWFPQVCNLQVAPLRFTEKSLRRDALNFLSPSRQADFPCTPSRGSPQRVCLWELDFHQLLPISFPPPPRPAAPQLFLPWAPYAPSNYCPTLPWEGVQNCCPRFPPFVRGPAVPAKGRSAPGTVLGQTLPKSAAIPSGPRQSFLVPRAGLLVASPSSSDP